MGSDINILYIKGAVNLENYRVIKKIFFRKIMQNFSVRNKLFLIYFIISIKSLYKEIFAIPLPHPSSNGGAR